MKTPQVVYEDNHLLIIDKPAGWLVQGDHTGDETLTDWGRAYIKEKYNKPGAVFLHPAHRLDRPVSGITIFCRTSKSLERMTGYFRDDKVHKTYLAVVKGRPTNPSATLIHWLEKDGSRNMVKAFGQEKTGSKKAELSYIELSHDSETALLQVHPKTGRSHQIRVQLAKMGCPIQGDLKYGFKEPNLDKSISLHAYQVSFLHPVTKEDMTVTRKPIWKVFKSIINGLD